MDQKPDKYFHDRESDDVYDLYNACSGTMHNGKLDVRKLDDLSREEKEMLNVPKLKELWHHIDSGCSRCETIIQTLNSARRALALRSGIAREKPKVFTTQM